MERSPRRPLSLKGLSIIQRQATFYPPTGLSSREGAGQPNWLPETFNPLRVNLRGAGGFQCRAPFHGLAVGCPELSCGAHPSAPAPLAPLVFSFSSSIWVAYRYLLAVITKASCS